MVRGHDSTTTASRTTSRLPRWTRLVALVLVLASLGGTMTACGGGGALTGAIVGAAIGGAIGAGYDDCGYYDDCYYYEEEVYYYSTAPVAYDDTF